MTRPDPIARTVTLALGLAAVAALWIAALAPAPAASLRAAVSHAAAGVAVLVTLAAATAKLRLRGRQPVEARGIIGPIVAAAAWLLPLMLALAARSLWTLPAAVVFAALVTALFRKPRLAPRFESSTYLRPPLFSFPERPAEDTARSLASQVAALALYGAVACVASGAVLPAALFAALACGLVAWFLPHSGNRRSGASARVAAALLVATIVLTPWADYLPGGSGPGGNGASASAGEKERPSGGASAPGGQFSGVVLLTRLEPETAALKAPPPLRPSSNPLAPSSPDTILFSGEYWYFYWPRGGPAADALRKLGDPKLLTYRSVDQSPLIMQARQPLRRPIPTSCCGEIEVVVDVREEEPESVSVELILLDSSQKTTLRQSLGARDLPPASPLPAKLRYRVPRPSRIQSFNEILVWFHLQAPRHGHSARVAIDRFNLIP